MKLGHGLGNIHMIHMNLAYNLYSSELEASYSVSIPCPQKWMLENDRC